MGILSKLKRYYFFHGEDEYLKWKRIKNLVNSVIDSGFKDFDYTFYEGRGLDGATLINTVSSPPFGSPLRVTVVRNFNKMSPKNQELVIKFIDKVPEHSTMVITAGKLDGKDKRKKVYKALLANKSNHKEFKQLSPAEAVIAMIEYAKELEITVSEKALDYLVETVGCNIGILEQELQKLAIYAGDVKTVSREDIANLIGAGTLGTVADLPIRIAEKDISGALRLLHKLLLTKESEGTMLFRIKDFFLKLNTAKMYNATSFVLMKNLHFSKTVADTISRLAPLISSDTLNDCLHDIYEAEISLKSAGMRKDILLINLVSSLGSKIAGNKQPSNLY